MGLASASISSGLTALNLKPDYPWVLASPVVWDVAREAMEKAGRGHLEPKGNDLVLAARKVIAAAAAQATPHPDEALGAIGCLIPNTSLTRRCDLAAKGRLPKKAKPSGKYWSEKIRANSTRLIAEELFKTFAYNKRPLMRDGD